MQLEILDGRYVIDAAASRRLGGMAEVVRATDMKTQKTVAIKFFSDALANDKYHMEAFNRESRALESLSHPNIVRLLDGGRAPDGRPYLVLEWIEQTLSAYLAANPPEGWDDYYETIGRPILSALSYALARDFSHRDIKPGNILVDSEGAVRVTDFGISKYRRESRLGITLSEFKSKPYAPPEADRGQYSDTRDVFGFAVLTLSCLTSIPLESYDDVHRAIEELDAPPDVISVLRACIDNLPEQRPANIGCLETDLERIYASRARAWTPIRACYLQVSSRALRRLQRSLVAKDNAQSLLAIRRDLHESCHLRTSSANTQSPRLARDPAVAIAQMIGAQFLFDVAVADGGDHLVVIDASRPSAAILDQLRLEAWPPQIDVRLGKPFGKEDGHGTITWLLSSLAEFEATQAEVRYAARQDQLFREWERLLNARHGLERSRRRALPFVAVQRDGARIRLELVSPPDHSIVGQPWYVALEGGRVLPGEIESVEGNSAILWSDGLADDPIPSKGELHFDTRADRKALQKQRSALDSIRFERSVRPGLKALLANPAQSTHPVPQPPADFFQRELDVDKQDLVARALGSSDLLLVEGPPGTGKTRLIAELILQELRRAPSTRILIASQTHVALDNALERVLAIDPQLKVVRVGRETDPRIAPSVLGVLLDTKAEKWLTEVRAKSVAFLERWAVENGLARKDVALGILISRLRLALLAEDSARTALQSATTDLGALQSELKSRESRGDNTTYHELSERVSQSEEQLLELRRRHDQLEAQVKAAKKSVTEADALGAELASQSPADLGEWEAEYLASSPAALQCRAMIELAEEWELRFGKSSDFHGALLADSQVVAGTCVGFISPRGIQELEFDLCIVDEASKASVTELLIPLSRSKRWVVVGDRKQLPPFVDEGLSSEVLDEYELSKGDVERTLLDHLAEQLPAECSGTLTWQHRMRPEIGTPVCECFYNGKVKNAGQPTAYTWQVAVPQPVTWYSTSQLPNNREISAHPSYKNMAEVRVALRVVRRIDFVAKALGRRCSLVFLTGYGAQRLEFEREYAKVRSAIKYVDVMANTVDAFQGREADIAVYSITRANDRGLLGFLGERKRLNVALSRAKDALVIVGDDAFCRGIKGRNPFEDVLAHVEGTKGCVLEAADHDA